MGKITLNLGGGTSFTIFLIMLILKLAGVITWSWWIVTLPLWIWIPLLLALFAFLVVVGLVGTICILIWYFFVWLYELIV
jgi:hypothetical protein